MMDLKSASVALAKELSSKNFPREKRSAYLSCFLSIGVIDDFLTALETEAIQQSAPLTGLTWRCGVCYRVNNRSNKVCWFCETDPQVA